MQATEAGPSTPLRFAEDEGRPREAFGGWGMGDMVSVWGLAFGPVKGEVALR